MDGRSGEFGGIVAGHGGDAARGKRKRRWDGRKLDAERRAALGPVVAGDLPTLILDQPIANTETEASAPPDGLGRIERIEYEAGIAKAGPGVGEEDDNLALF